MLHSNVVREGKFWFHFIEQCIWVNAKVIVAVWLVPLSVLVCCRETRTLELSTGEQLQYDLLVLTTGVQDQTLHSIKSSGVEGVVPVPELAAHFRSFDATELHNLLVYGHTLDAYHALSVLEERGVQLADSVLHLAPLREPSPIVGVMHAVRPLQTFHFRTFRFAAIRFVDVQNQH